MKVMLISNLILNTLDYCNAVLACATAKDLKPLQKIPNRAVRFAFRLKRWEHITPYLKQLHFLPVKYRIMFKLCLISFDIVNCTSPSYLTDLFETYQPTTTINLRFGVGRDEYILVHNSNHNADSRKNIFTKMTKTWNNLPLTLRSTESRNAFKSNLKTHYFKLAYDNWHTIAVLSRSVSMESVVMVVLCNWCVSILCKMSVCCTLQCYQETLIFILFRFYTNDFYLHLWDCITTPTVWESSMSIFRILYCWNFDLIF